MQQITTPEILWRIFTLVESNADLARAGRLNKFIGAIALDVLWNDIEFKSFLSLFPTRTTQVQSIPGWQGKCTNIVIPILLRHWERANLYARRVRTLRRSWIGRGMEQVLTSLKLYNRGSEMPFIFPRLRCLVWDCHYGRIHELSLIAALFFTPTLQELSIKTEEYDDEHEPPPLESRLPHGLSLLVPLQVMSESSFPNLRKLHLPLPGLSTKSLESYHAAIMDLIPHLSKGQLQDVSLVITKDILQILSTFPNLHSLELYDLSKSFSSKTSKLSKDYVPFENLRSLIIRNLHSVTSLSHLNDFQCAPSLHMEIHFADYDEDEDDLKSDIFTEVVYLLHPRRSTLESLEVQGNMDLTCFSKWLFAIPNMKKLCLGPGITLKLQDNTLEPISSEWGNLTFLSLSDEDDQPPYINFHGMVCPNIHCTRSFQFYFTSTQDNAATEKIVDLTFLSKWLLTFPHLKELFLGPHVTLNIQDDVLGLMGTKWRDLNTLFIYNKASLITLSGIMSLSHCPITGLSLSFILTQKDIDHFRQLINNSEISPLYSLTDFYVDELINGFGTNVAGAVFVLAYLFPNATLTLSSDSKASPDRYVQEALQARKVVLKMLETTDMHNLMQIVGKDRLIAH